MPTVTARHIGGSILPSSSPHVLAPMRCGRGTFQVVAVPDLDTHALTFLSTWHAEQGHGPVEIAIHANGHSCHALAKRMVQAVEGLAGAYEAVLQQAAYIEDCGGLAAPRKRLRAIIRGDA